MKYRKFCALFLLVVVWLASLACALAAQPITRKFQFVSLAVDPPASDGSSALQLSIKYNPAGAEDTVKLYCFYTAGSDPQVIAMADIPGFADVRTLDVSFEFRVAKPGDYQAYCKTSDGAQSAYAPFQIQAPVVITDPQAKPGQPAEPPAAGGFPKHTPGEITSAGLWMLFDQGTSDSADRVVPRQCLPGVNYTHVGGASRLDIAPDGALSGSCSLTEFGGSERLTGSLTGMWHADTGEVTFHLETTMVYSASRAGQNGVTIVGQTTEITIYDGSGAVTSEYQATGSAAWTTKCSSSNTDAVACSQARPSGLTASGSVPWQLNFNP